MNLLKTEKAEKSTVKVEFSIEKSVFDAAVEKVYRKQVKKINIPGFRPGKAPRAMIEKMYGASVFYDDAINDLLPENYEAAIKAAEVEPVGQPEIEVLSIDENGVVISATVPVKPECTIDGYKGIEVAKPEAVVDEAEIDREIEQVRIRNVRQSEITDAPAAMGNVAQIDFEGFCDGVAFDGGKGEDYRLELGSGSFIPGFEEQVAGHSIGEQFDVNVTFPEEYHAESLAGKPAVFKVTIKAIFNNEYPELDDDFAKDVSEFDTFVEYRDDIRAKIQKRAEAKAEADFEEAILTVLAEKLEGEIPEAMFAAEVENIIRDYDNNLRQRGLDLKTYLQYTKGSLESLREQVRPQAEKQLKARLALEAVAKAENLEITDEELDAEYQLLASNYNMDAAQIKEFVEPDMIRADVLVRKAMKLIKENVKA